MNSTVVPLLTCRPSLLLPCSQGTSDAAAEAVAYDARLRQVRCASPVLRTASIGPKQSHRSCEAYMAKLHMKS